VPEEVAVAGFDDVEGMSVPLFDEPFLTTVRDPNFEMGVTAAELLLEQIEQGRPLRQVVLPADACAPGRNPANYAPMIRALRELPCCVGWHVCGAYLNNRCRGYGFRDEQERLDEGMVAAATAANQQTIEATRGD
jgi:hypothetical protein